MKNETNGACINPKFAIFKNNLRLFSEYSSTPSKISFEKVYYLIYHIVFR